MKFDLEYRCESRDGEVVTWDDTVAKIEINFDCPEFSKARLISEIDDFLLIESLAEGQRCACLEIVWDSGDEITYEYRMNRAAPVKGSNSQRDFLISGAEVEVFSSLAYNNLKVHSQYGLVKSALQAMTLFEDETIGVKFMRLFSAFEGLVLAFRRIENLEFSIPKFDDRQAIERAVSATLKSHELLKGEPKLRALLYENISGLFRISLRQAATEFFTKNNIVLTDTWAMFDTSGGISLLQIRNRIAHGENFNKEEWWDIIEALKSLNTILDRCILSMLGWDYQKSKSHLRHELDPKLESARRALSQAIAPVGSGPAK